MVKRLALFAALLALAASIGLAGQFPSKTITVLIPKAPGGGTDLTARTMIEFAKKHLNVNIVGTNKPAAAGVTAMIELARAKPDGYTLGMFVVEYAMLPHLGRCPVTYKDITPLACAISAPGVLAVHKDAPYNTLAEFIRFAKDNPGKAKIGNSGIGSIRHVGTVAMEESLGVSVTPVPYDKGTAEAVAALVGGHIDGVFASPGEVITQYNAGNIKILATTSPERVESIPDVPTFAELGYPDVPNLGAWAAMVAPANLDPEAKAVLSDAFYKAITDPGFKEYMVKQGTDIVQYDAKTTEEMIKRDHEFYGVYLKKIGIE